jgi:hypothetical protein
MKYVCVKVNARWRQHHGSSKQWQATAAAVQAVDHCCVALQCLKYKTDQQVDVKKMEKLNSLFFVLMARGEHPTGACAVACSSFISSEHLQQQHQQIEACSPAVDGSHHITKRASLEEFAGYLHTLVHCTTRVLGSGFCTRVSICIVPGHCQP